MAAHEYICDKCGERFYDDSINPYTNDTMHIKNDALWQQVIHHAMETGHHSFSVPGTNLKLCIG